jgi:uncharacterized protein (TIGR02145 family)
MEKNQRRSLIIIAVLFVGIVCAIGQYMGAFNAMYVLATDPNPGHSWNQMECSTGLCVDTVNNRVGVGTTSPQTNLHVVGGFKVGAHTTCDSSTGAWSFTTPVSVSEPTASNHAATKSYVDSCVRAITNCGSSFTDPRDGKVYSTFLAGCQCWMAENIDYDEGWCYNSIQSNCDTYGTLYHHSLTDVCPSGWHLPSLAEYNTLESVIGSTEDKWMDSNGWAALFSGRGIDPAGGSFADLGNKGFFWTSDTALDGKRWALTMTNYGGMMRLMLITKLFMENFSRFVV